MKSLLLIAGIALLASGSAFAEGEGGGGNGGGGGGGGGYPGTPPSQSCSTWSWGKHSQYYRPYRSFSEAMNHCFCPDSVQRVYDAYSREYNFMCIKQDNGGGGNG